MGVRGGGKVKINEIEIAKIESQTANWLFHSLDALSDNSYKSPYIYAQWNSYLAGARLSRKLSQPGSSFQYLESLPQKSQRLTSKHFRWCSKPLSRSVWTKFLLHWAADALSECDEIALNIYAPPAVPPHQKLGSFSRFPITAVAPPGPYSWDLWLSLPCEKYASPPLRCLRYVVLLRETYASAMSFPRNSLSQVSSGDFGPS